MDGNLPGSSVHEILQARTLEWIAMPSSRESSRPRDGNCLSYVCLLHWQAGSLPVVPAGKPIGGPYGSIGPVPLTFFMSSLGLSGIQVITDGQVVFLVLCDKIVHFK